MRLNKSKKNKFNQGETLMGNQFWIFDFLSKDNIHLSKEYKIKSPPLGIGSIGELREAFNIDLKEKRLIKILYKE